MSWLRNNWPSFSNDWDLPFGTLTDLIGIGLGFVVLCLTIYVALKQLRIMRDQTAMMAEQGRLSKRQTELAEIQDSIIQEELRRRIILDMSLGPGVSIKDGYTRYRIQIHNNGNRTMKDFAIDLMVPVDVFHVASTELNASTLDPDELALAPDGPICRSMYVNRKTSVYPKTIMEVGQISIKSERPDDIVPRLYWRASCEDGQFPKDGYGILFMN